MPEKIRLTSIKKTAVTYWSNEDECYVMESPLFSRCVAIGDSPYEAKSKYEEMLDTAYEHIQNENVAGYNRVGRPAKGNIEIHASIRPTTREDLKKLCEDLNISIGEAIDYLLFFHSVKNKEQKNTSDESNVATLDQIYSNTISISKELKSVKRLLKDR